MTEIEKPERALKQLVNVLFAGFVRGEKFVKIEIRKSSIRYARGKELPQAPRFDGSKLANFLKNNALERVLKNSRIEQMANLQPSPTLDQHRAKKS